MMPIVNSNGENITHRFKPDVVERLMWTRVENCPNNGGGDCYFFHTCVSYVADEEGNLVPESPSLS